MGFIIKMSLMDLVTMQMVQTFWKEDLLTVNWMDMASSGKSNHVIFY